MGEVMHVTVEVNTAELREWADKHADAGHHGVAHVLYKAAEGIESVTEQHDREVEARALREAADEVRVEARWATECRRSGRVYYPVKRLLEVETVLRDRADRIASP